MLLKEEESKKGIFAGFSIFTSFTSSLKYNEEIKANLNVKFQVF
jgi:hypothetical protein